MVKSKSTKDSTSVDIVQVETGTLEVCVLGTSPIVLNRMSEKAARELLMPRGKKNAAEKAVTLKHDPMAEYRASPYRLIDDAAPTLLAFPAAGFKGAMASAALDLPGTKKAQIGRLTWVTGDRVPLYGVPQLFMAVVRSADMNRTPDIRTRAIIPEWACRLTITFVKPLMRANAVANLLAAGGMYIGVGDGRNEKGKLSYGQFTLVDRDDPKFIEIVKGGGRAAQAAAMEAPQCYDDETASLLGWFDEELAKRSQRGVA